MTWLNSPDESPRPSPAPVTPSPVPRSNPFTAWLCGIAALLGVVGALFIYAGSRSASAIDGYNLGFIGGGIIAWGASFLMLGILVAAIDWIVSNRR